MKVLIINKHFKDAMGGSEIQCHIIASHLMGLGHNVVYGVVDAGRKSYGVDYDCLPIRKNFWIGLKRAIKKTEPDVVYWRLNKSHLLASVFLTRFYKSKFVFAVSHIRDTKRWINAGHRMFFFRYDPNRSSFRNYIRLAVVLLSPFVSAFNYFGFYLVDAVCHQRDDLKGVLPVRREVKINNSFISNFEPFEWHKPYVVWVANLKLKKNPEKFIQIASHFLEWNVDFIMIGSIKDYRYDYIRNKASLPSNLYYLGEKTYEEVNGIIRSSLFLVHTCNPEGFPNNFIQAWMQAKPTISLFFDPDSIITDNGLGFFSGSMDQFVRDTEKLIEDQTLRKEMGDRANTFAQEHFSAKANVKKLESFLLSIID